MKLVDLTFAQLNVQPIYVEKVIDDEVILVFLHEALGSIGQWKNFPQQLCATLQLNGIVYERQGYGQSTPLSKPRDKQYLHGYALDELPILLDILIPLDKKVILVGHSDGGSIALLYAAKFPNRVKSIVSMAAHVIVEDITLKGIEPAVQAYEAGKLDGLKRYHGEKTNELFYAWARTWNLPEFKDWNICQDIQTIQCSVLALQGVNDQYGSELQLDLIEKSILGGRVEKVLLPKCGHHPHLEQMNETINAIVKWHSSIK